MTLSNEKLFRVTGPLWGEFTGHRWIPLTKASDAELRSFLWSTHEQTIEQTIETPVVWDAVVVIMTPPSWVHIPKQVKDPSIGPIRDIHITRWPLCILQRNLNDYILLQIFAILSRLLQVDVGLNKCGNV